MIASFIFALPTLPDLDAVDYVIFLVLFGGAAMCIYRAGRAHERAAQERRRLIARAPLTLFPRGR